MAEIKEKYSNDEPRNFLRRASITIWRMCVFLSFSSQVIELTWNSKWNFPPEESCIIVDIHSRLVYVCKIELFNKSPNIF